MQHAPGSSALAMLLIVIRRGYLCYIISLCYVIIALMAAFCLDCTRVVHPRSRRGTPDIPFVCGSSCMDCATSPNGCADCRQHPKMSFRHVDLNSQRAYCLHRCPPGHYDHRSKIEGNTCRECGRGCLSCDHVTTCNRCLDSFFLYKKACVARCPARTHPNNNNTCVNNHRRIVPTCPVARVPRYSPCCRDFVTCARRRRRKRKCYNKLRTCKKKINKCRNRIHRRKCNKAGRKGHAARKKSANNRNNLPH